MADWKVASNLAEARALLEDARTRLESSGVERVAAEIAAQLHDEASGAFASKADPRTGAPWQGPSEFTLRSPGFRALLVRTGELAAGVRSGYALTPRGARAFLNIDGKIVTRGLVHLYGVVQRPSRSYTIGTGRYAGRVRTRRRMRPGAWMPRRSFVGLSPAGFREMMRVASKELLPNG